MSRTLAIGTAAAGALLLGGCASLFAPDPIPTASPASLPTHTASTTYCAKDATTRFRWTGSPTDGGYQATSFVSMAYEGRNGGSESSDAPGSSVGLTFDGDSTLGDGTLSNTEQWAFTAADDLRASGLAPKHFGDVSSLDDDSAFTPPQPHAGIWVRVVVARTETYRFTMTCRDGAVFGGTLTGPVTGGSHEFVLHCDSARHPRDTPQRAAARAVCGSVA